MTEINNLDALAGQIYQEGVEKANKEAEEIKQRAEADAQHALDNANAEAEKIISNAKKETDKLRASVLNELEVKSKQALSDLKSTIESSVLNDTLVDPVKETFNSNQFIETLLITISKKWSKADEIEIELSKELNDEVSNHIKSDLKANLAKLKFKPVESMSAGFVVNVKDKGYFLSFTDEDFIEFLKPYYSSKVQEILFK